MLQPKSFFFWILILMGSIALGIAIYCLFFSHLQMITGTPQNVQLSNSNSQLNLENNPKIPQRTFEYPNNSEYLTEKNQNSTPVVHKYLANPFVMPGLDSSNHPFSQRRHELLEYKGAIETDTNILGIVRINTTGESLVVSEGEDLVISGIVIVKITPKTLTYSQNGTEKVIYLGGTSN